MLFFPLLSIFTRQGGLILQEGQRVCGFIGTTDIRDSLTVKVDRVQYATFIADTDEIAVDQRVARFQLARRLLITPISLGVVVGDQEEE